MSKEALLQNFIDLAGVLLLEQKYWGKKWGYLGENIT